MTQYIRADRVVTGDSVHEDGALLIEDGRIVAAGPSDAVPTTADVSRSLDGYTVLPGLIDGHVHISGPAPGTGSTTDLFENSPSEVTVRTIRNARRTLRAGVTTVRDLGSPNDVAMTVRDAIADGTFAGPRILTSGQGLTATGGHGDLVPWHVDTHLDTESGNLGSKGLVVDGEDEVRRGVRRQAKLGADLVKVWATDGINDPGDGRRLTFTRDELAAVVDEADRYGLPVAAHAYSDEAVEACVRAGVRSVEHGHYLSEETAALMADRGVFLDFTFAAFHALATDDRYDNENPRRALDHQRSMVPTLREHDVNVAMGTDAGTVVDNGDNAVELGLLVAAGLDPLDAIRVATAETARMLGLDAVGRLEEGYAADVVAVRGNPLSDVTVLEDPDRVDLVLKGGEVVRDARTDGERRPDE